MVEHGETGDVASAAANLRAVAAAAATIRSTLGDGDLHGDAADLAGRTLRVAVNVLERLAAEGWESLLGPGNHGAEGERFAVVERATGPTSGARLLTGLV